MAPAVVFVEVFERKGVPITMAEARAPMGAHKRVHIRKIAEQDADLKSELAKVRASIEARRKQGGEK